MAVNMGSLNCATLLTLGLFASVLQGCGGDATSPGTTGGSAALGTGGTANGGSNPGLGGAGSAATWCIVGADQTCNDDPRVSSLWGRCQAGICQCDAGFEVNPSTGKCRVAEGSDCYSPSQNVDRVSEDGFVGCSCDAARDRHTCREDSSGRLVSFSCEESRWLSVEDGSCSFVAASISLTRSLCFGFCPSYSLTISADGFVSYSGEAFVRVHGQASRFITPSAVSALAKELENAGYFQLSIPEQCSTRTSDAPLVTTSLTRDGATRRIAHDLGNDCAPPVLTMLEERIDQVAGSSDWVACPPNDYCEER